MLIETKGKAIELLNKALPYPEQMIDIDLEKDRSVYFTWRSQRYKLELEYCMVMRSNGSILEGDDASF